MTSAPPESSLAAPTVVVVVDGTTIPAWVHCVLTSLDQTQTLAWDSTFVVQTSARARTAGGLGARVFNRIDARRFASRIDDALRPQDASVLLVRHGAVEVIDQKGTPSALHEVLRRSDTPVPDVVLDLRAGDDSRLRGDLASRGVWRIALETDGTESADPVYAAIYARRSTCDVRLLVLSPGAADATVVATATVGLRAASLTLSRSLCYWKGAQLVTKMLGELGDDRPRTPLALDATAPIAAVPRVALGGSLTSAVRMVSRRGMTALRHRTSGRRIREQWLLGVRRRETDELSFDDDGFQTVVPPPDRTFADPFLLRHQSTTYLFLEDLEFGCDGRIAVMKVDDEGQFGTPEVVLERSYHLSYPFVFRDGSDYYMLPETASNGTVELYRATDFPNGWELHDVLFQDVRALDSSIMIAGGTYWLFTSLEEAGRNRNDELHLFSSRALDGPWVPHPQNPVVSDVRYARSAGRIFSHGGALVRPAQDCSSRYGFAIVFRRIDVLTDREYEERTIGVLGPTWAPGLLATHTFSTVGRLDVVDGLRTIRRA